MGGHAPWRWALALLLLAPVSAQGLERGLDEVLGRALFRRAWVPAPSSTRANDGLGPLFNARSCAACHGGLERAPVPTDAAGTVTGDNLVLRFSDADGRPDPVYGRQMQTSAVAGVTPEGRLAVSGRDYRPADLAYGPLAPGTRTGALLAPSLGGLGELESVPDEALAAIAAENGRRDDGVRGRVRWVEDGQGRRRAGRFGWKASQPSLAAQVETAFALDLGLSTAGRPQPEGDCTPAQSACRAAPMGDRNGGPEISQDIVLRIAAYLASIEPAPGPEPDRRALAVFEKTGCAACHRASLPGKAGPVRAFTDLLLHDLGPGLDGGATEPGVASTEWRTPPLRGLSRTLTNGAGLLHDGRAATVEEAIALHGGEASSSRNRFMSLPEAEKRRLLDFLKSL
ncbi:di-heme oxidoredictase family protein [Microvirga thermotolerans]|uniref:Cytochrome c domain-containing protein n=1 Tax=Microvirga thermotolerans TaxID=2651334 RepID=A0A5P9JYN7_9HYPH|nr:di-heme oxidoredictase family protein [Microvirga thermotolerans]QFU16756.1 hypothetical protein GDR74_11240 [Microvirga thermotolerans]